MKQEHIGYVVQLFCVALFANFVCIKSRSMRFAFTIIWAAALGLFVMLI